jgi:predicted nucleic acid-binding protein
MKGIVFDTNALISYVTLRNPAQHQTISHIIEECFKHNIEINIIENVVTEFVYVLNKIYSISAKEINAILQALNDTPGIVIKNFYQLDLILELWPDKIQGYGDAVLAAYAKKKKVPIFTFDKALIKKLQTLKIPLKV